MRRDVEWVSYGSAGAAMEGAMGASAALLIGKFQFNNDPAMYLGLGVLIAASAWNTWPAGS